MTRREVIDALAEFRRFGTPRYDRQFIRLPKVRQWHLTGQAAKRYRGSMKRLRGNGGAVLAVATAIGLTLVFVAQQTTQPPVAIPVTEAPPLDQALAALLDQVVARSQAMRAKLQPGALASAGLLLLAAGQPDRARAMLAAPQADGQAEARQNRLQLALNRYAEGAEPVLTGRPYPLDEDEPTADCWDCEALGYDLRSVLRAGPPWHQDELAPLFEAAIVQAREPRTEDHLGIDCWSGDPHEETRLDLAVRLATIAKAMILTDRRDPGRKLLDEARELATAVTPIDWDQRDGSRRYAPLYGQAKVLGEIGEGYTGLGDFATARALADLALPPDRFVSRSSERPIDLNGPAMNRSDLLASVGRAQARAGDLDGAKASLDDALACLPAGSDGEGSMFLSGIRVNILELMIEAGQIDRAKEWVGRDGGCGEEGSDRRLAAYLALHQRSREALGWALQCKPPEDDDSSGWCTDHLFVEVVETVAWLALNGEAPLTP